MIDKRVASVAEAVADIPDGATVLIGGFGEAGSPTELIHALIDRGARGLTVVNNNAGNGHIGLAALLEQRRVARMICTYPRSSHSEVFEEVYRAGEVALEVVPQGTLAERLRAAGAGARRVLHADDGGNPAGRRQGDPHHRLGASMCSNTRSTPISRWSRRSAPTAGATSPTGWRRAISGR